MNGSYQCYTDGEQKDVFIKAYQKGPIFTGKVWPGDAAFPDFFNDAAVEWWKDWLTKFHEIIPFDGLWQDMNEASNFCTGTCHKEQTAKHQVKRKLPYTPTGRDLEEKSMPLDAFHDSIKRS